MRTYLAPDTVETTTQCHAQKIMYCVGCVQASKEIENQGYMYLHTIISIPLLMNPE